MIEKGVMKKGSGYSFSRQFLKNFGNLELKDEDKTDIRNAVKSSNWQGLQDLTPFFLQQLLFYYILLLKYSHHQGLSPI